MPVNYNHLHKREFHYKKDAAEFAWQLKREPNYNPNNYMIFTIKTGKYWAINWARFAADLCSECRR